MTRRGFMGATAALALSGCSTPSRSFRERLTLFVETPDGLASGSSVTEHYMGFQDGWLGGLAGNALVQGMRGEATVVDLGARGLLFALLTPDRTRRGKDWQSGAPGGYEYTVFAALCAQAKREAGDSTERGIAYFIDTLNRQQPKGDVPLHDLSLLARFRDPNDPRTVERVDPLDLAASFGAGVTLTRATIEITDAPLTTGIEERLPWLKGGHGETPLFPENNGRLLADIPPIQLLIHFDFWRNMQ